MSIRAIAGPGLVLAIAAFLAVTTLPPRLLDPFAESRVSYAHPGGVEVAGQSLIVSAPGPGPLDAAPYRERRFAVRLVLRAQQADQRGPARIVAYSRNPDVTNWLIGQSGAGLHVRHGGRRTTFPAVFRAGEEHRLSLVFENQTVTLLEPGREARRATLRGTDQPWQTGARLTLANEVTGDRPWLGTIRELELFEDGSAAAAWRLVTADDHGPVLVAPDGGRVGLVVVSWPWKLKLERLLAGYSERRGSFGDVARNLLLGAPVGFLLGLLLGSGGAARAVLGVILVQGGLSVVAETLQFFSRYRTGDWVDVLANVGGALAGLAVARIVARGRPG